MRTSNLVRDVEVARCGSRRRMRSQEEDPKSYQVGTRCGGGGEGARESEEKADVEEKKDEPESQRRSQM